MNGGGFQLGKMPKSVTCYICGRGYGTKSISIHLKACEKKWDIEQQQKPKKQRKPCPQPPKGFNEIISKKNVNMKDLEQLNNKAFENYDQMVLERCQFCNRTFNPEAFVRHQNICTASKPLNPLKKNIIEKKQQKQQNKDVLQNTTKNNVQKIQNINTQLEKPLQSQQNNQQFTEEYESKENQDLEQCHKCNRNFFADRLQKHMKVCKGNTKPINVQKQVQKQQKNKNSKKDPKWKQQHKDFMETMKYMKQVAQAEKEGKSLKNLPPPPKSRNPDFLECPSCNRSFNPTAHERHIKTCANIVNKPKMLKRKNYGKNNRGYQLHLIIINSVIMRSQSHQNQKNVQLQNSINSSQHLRLSIKAKNRKIKITDSQLPQAQKLHQKFIQSNRKTQLDFSKLKNKKNVAKIQQTNKKKMSNKNFDSLQNYFQMIMQIENQFKKNDIRKTFQKQKMPLKYLFCKNIHEKIKKEDLINKPNNKPQRCSVNPHKFIISPQPRLSTKPGRKIFSLNPMLDKEDKENNFPLNQKLQEMYFKQCQRKLDFNQFQKNLDKVQEKQKSQLPVISQINKQFNNSNYQKFGGTNFTYVPKMNIINPFKKPKNNTSYRLGFYKQQKIVPKQQEAVCQFNKQKQQQQPIPQQTQNQVDQQKDLNFTFSNFPNN